MKFKYNIFFCLAFSILFGCAASTAQQRESAPLPVSPAQALASVECGANEFRGQGAGASEQEALNMARSAIAQQIQSSVKVSQTHTQSQTLANGRESLSAGFASQTSVEAALQNAHDARILRIERGAGEIGAVLCMSRADAAKGFVERLRPIAASLEFSAATTIDEKHPKLKSEAWQKTQPLWREFVPLQSMIEGLDKEKATLFEPVATLYAKARDGYLSYCQTAKLYWNPERENLYSGLAFSKLSKNLKLEKSACEGYGVSLIYKNAEHKCELAGIFNCSYQPALLIASCEGSEYRLLENPSIGSYHQKEDVSLEKLHEKLRNEAFWSEWEQEIEQWRPQCE